MKYFNTSPNQEEPRADINMSPLVDMVFLLLIFFMVTSVFVSETGIEVKRPQAQSATTQNLRSLLVALTSDNRIYYGGAEIPLNRVSAILSREFKGEPLPVVILADESSSTGFLVQLIDQCKLSGATDVNVSATKP